jgi:tetratricopeptide (TPR) repeat protein
MLCKPQAVCLPVVLIAMELIRRPSAWKRSSLRLLPWLVLVIPIILVGKENQPALERGSATPIQDRPLVAMDDLVFYGGKVIAPFDLAVDYNRNTEWLLRHGPHLAAWVVPPVVLVLAWLLRRRARWVAVGLAIFVCALIPILGFVPFNYQMYSNVADHYLYLAMLGPALIAAALLQTGLDYRAGQPAAGVVAGILVALCVIASYREADYWRDNFALFDRNLELYPESFAATDQVATHYARGGDFGKALELYNRVLALQPKDYETRFDVGNVLSMQNRLAEASASYRLALEGLPNRADIRMNLAADLMRLNDFKAATRELEIANGLQPRNPGVLYNLAILAETDEHNRSKAKEYLLQALDANPTYQPARQMMQQLSGTEVTPFQGRP